jgi:hypothetical protein
MIAGPTKTSSSTEVLDGSTHVETVLSMARDIAVTPVAAPASMARGMSNEECVAAARMTMWRLDGGRSR